MLKHIAEGRMTKKELVEMDRDRYRDLTVAQTKAIVMEASNRISQILKEVTEQTGMVVKDIHFSDIRLRTTERVVSHNYGVRIEVSFDLDYPDPAER